MTKESSDLYKASVAHGCLAVAFAEMAEALVKLRNPENVGLLSSPLIIEKAMNLLRDAMDDLADEIYSMEEEAEGR